MTDQTIEMVEGIRATPFTMRRESREGAKAPVDAIRVS